MLRLLTDEHISPRVATTARGLCPTLEVTAIRDWHAGHLLGASDEVVLREARGEGLTLVTYDLRTIPPLLRTWAEQEIEHGGVVLVDARTLSPTDVSGIAASLCRLWRAHGRADWTNRVLFLRRLPR